MPEAKTLTPAAGAHCGGPIRQVDGDWEHASGAVSCRGDEGAEQVATPTPTCSRCGAALVARVNPTLEQAWCGEWFDHPPVPFDRCGNQRGSVLLASAALNRQDEEQRREAERRGRA